VTPEDRLRELLHEHDDVPVTGDGLSRIQQRLEARRSRVLVPAAALAGVVVAAAVGVYAVSVTDDGTVRPRPAVRRTPQPSPTSTVCSGGLCPEPRPSPSVPLTAVTTSGDGLPGWPFTTDAQAADWVASPGERRWAADPVQVTQHLLDDLLELPGEAVGTAGRGGDVVQVVVKAAGRPVSTVQLEQVGRGTNGPWSVTGASAEDVSITTPKAGGDVASPLTVTGRVTGYDESVRVRLFTGAGAQLADGHAPAGAEQPWSQPLRWSQSTWTVGLLTASTYDGKGDLHALAVTPVRRGGAGSPGVPASGTTVVAIQEGHVVLADALTGARLRQLSYPPEGDVDSDPGRGGTDGVVWARTKGDGCTSSIIRIGLAHGAAGVTVDAKPRHRRLPALSSGGSRLAWVEDDCSPDATETVVVRGPDARFATVVAAPGHVTALDVRDDGTALVGLADRSYVVPPGAASFAAARRLVASAGCTVTAPAWDDAVVTAWQRCSDGSRLSRFTDEGRPASTGPAVPDVVVRMSVADGFVLVVREDGSPARFSEGRLTAVPGGDTLLQAGW
jgi:hypothetical protein